MSKLAGQTRAALLGVLFAMVGFSYSLAYTDADVGPSASSRAVGSVAVKFTNPLLVGTNIRDLGDVTAGSTYTRYLRAVGGVVPYTFAQQAVGTAATASSLSTLSGVSLTSFALFGSFTFTVAQTVTQNIAVGFNVTDSVGSSDSSAFRLTLVSGTTFAFASSTLPSGVRFRPYTAGFEFVNGNGAITVSVDATSKATLSGLGLLVNADGTISGEPLSAGTFSINVTARDARNTAALSRNRATVGQTFTLTITDNVILSSEMVTTSIKIKQGKPGKDSISYAANITPGPLASFSGKTVELKIGSFTSAPVTLDSKGKITSADKTTKVSISSKGLVKFSANKQTLSGFTSGDVVVSLRLFDATLKADTFAGTEVVTLDLKLTYKIGFTPSGAFLVTSVSGKDSKTVDAVAYKIAFIALPSTRLSTSSAFNGALSAGVSIGTGVKAFSDVIDATVKNGTVKAAAPKGTKPDQQRVLKLAMSSKGKASAQTGALTAAATGISKASSGATPGPFAFKVSLYSNATGTGSPIFGGESGIKLVNTGKALTSSVK